MVSSLYMDQLPPQDQLSKEMAQLTRAVRHSNSFWRAVLVGIGRGLGVAIGATLVAAIVITLLWRVARTFHVDQFLGAGAGGPQGGIFQLLQQLPGLQKQFPALQQFDPAQLPALQRELEQGAIRPVQKGAVQK